MLRRNKIKVESVRLSKSSGADPSPTNGLA